MGQNSQIEWTHHTFNPWWGCTHVSTACVKCYAETTARRFVGDIWGKNKPRRTFGEDYWKQPVRWNEYARTAGQRERVFCASMADVFDPDGPESERLRLWGVVEKTPWLDWLLLTKRPERARQCLPPAWLAEPPANVWLGTSVENRQWTSRIDVLRGVPAALRFLSVEPLLEDVGTLDLRGIDWVIVGGESGAGARPMHAAWVRNVRDQCVADGVPLFFKQWGKLANNPDARDPTAKENDGSSKGGCTLDGRTWHQFPLTFQEAEVTASPVQT